jgi:hypothetical protein
MLAQLLPADVPRRALAGGSVSAYWYWDTGQPARLHIGVFADGEVVSGAFYQLTACRELVDHMLGLPDAV